MSGIEIVGVLLGVFPLCVSAMEHYEKTRRATNTFVKIRRTHKRDLGKIKDCELLYKLNLKQLLLPLLKEDVIEESELELLLSNPGGPAWNNRHVHSALKKRLGECHDRYLEILSDMKDTMVNLCELTKVHDHSFQRLLREPKLTQSQDDDAQQARHEILHHANLYIHFQLGKLQYAFTTARREELLEELESQNKRLETFLAAKDRESIIIQKYDMVRKLAISPRALHFWRHANDIYNVVETTWNCKCRPCLSLWLDHQIVTLPQMTFMIPFCHGRKSVKVSLSERKPGLELCASWSTDHGKRPLRPNIDPSSMPIHLQGPDTNSPAGTTSQPGSTTTCVARVPAFPKRQQLETDPLPTSPKRQRLETVQSQSPHLEDDGLCKAFSTSTASDSCVGTILEGDHEYNVQRLTTPVPKAKEVTLATLLHPGCQTRLSRVQRYKIALMLVTSHLQLYPTPW